jgi:hypothetical protein
MLNESLSLTLDAIESMKGKMFTKKKPDGTTGVYVVADVDPPKAFDADGGGTAKVWFYELKDDGSIGSISRVGWKTHAEDVERG